MRITEKHDFFEILVTAFIVLVFALIIVGMFFAFQPPKLTAGIVINKNYTPAHSGVYGSINNGSGSLHSYSTPECFSLCVQDGEVTEWWYVTEDTYNNHKVGDYIKR